MKTKRIFPDSYRRLAVMVAALTAFLMYAPHAQGAIVISVQSAAAAAGSTGNAIDVLLRNTGAPVTVDSFAFSIKTANPNIQFTSASFATVLAPYIFAGNSFDQNNSFALATSVGQTLSASDVADVGAGTVLATGSSFGLGRAIFDVLSTSTAGPFIVSFDQASTSLSDVGGQPIPIDSFVNGTITVTTTIPEPSSALFMLTGVSLAWMAVRYRQRLRS